MMTDQETADFRSGLRELTARQKGSYRSMNRRQRASTAPAPANNRSSSAVKPRVAVSAPTRLQTVARAVLSSPAMKGKEDAALQLLANDEFASVPASGILKILATRPAAVLPSLTDGQRAAAENIGREEMKAALAAVPRKGDGGQSEPSAAGGRSDALWDRAWASVSHATPN
jgi:hypothetical protein